MIRNARHRQMGQRQECARRPGEGLQCRWLAVGQPIFQVTPAVGHANLSMRSPRGRHRLPITECDQELYQTIEGTSRTPGKADATHRNFENRLKFHQKPVPKWLMFAVTNWRYLFPVPKCFFALYPFRPSAASSMEYWHVSSHPRVVPSPSDVSRSQSDSEKQRSAG